MDQVYRCKHQSGQLRVSGRITIYKMLGRGPRACMQLMKEAAEHNSVRGETVLRGCMEEGVSE